MIGFVVRCGDQFKTLRSGWTTDVLAAVRFAREEDAQQFADAPDEHAFPVLMSPQWPAELQQVRDAMREAEMLADRLDAMDRGWWRQSRQARALQRAADASMLRAQTLCYELFKRSVFRKPKVTI